MSNFYIKENTIHVLSRRKNDDFTIDLAQLGFSEEQLKINVTIPCHFSSELKLLANCCFLDSLSRPICLLLFLYPTTQKQELFTIANLYSDSCKALFGIRPIVYFIDENKVFASFGSVSAIKENPQFLHKDDIEIRISAEEIQEFMLYRALNANNKLALEYIEGDDTNIKPINEQISDTLHRAKKMGVTYYLEHYIYSDKNQAFELRRLNLLKNILPLSDYQNMVKDDCKCVSKYLNVLASSLFYKMVKEDNLLNKKDKDKINKSYNSFSLTYNGWDKNTTIEKNDEIFCYLDASVKLIADYAFYDNKCARLVIIKDNLNLTKEHAFLICEFYSRSYRAKFGICPLILFMSKNTSLAMSTSLTSSFSMDTIPLHKTLIKDKIVNNTVLEEMTFEDLLNNIEQIKTLPKNAFIKKVHDTSLFLLDRYDKIFSDTKQLRARYLDIKRKKRLSDERFWISYLGQDEYKLVRQKELEIVKTFVADKLLNIEQKKLDKNNFL